MWNLEEPGSSFGRLPQTTPKLYWRNPKLLSCWGKTNLFQLAACNGDIHGIPSQRLRTASVHPCPSHLGMAPWSLIDDVLVGTLSFL